MTLAAGVGFTALGETLLMAIEPAASMPDSVGLALMTSGTVMLTMMSVSILVVVSTLVGAAMPMVVSMPILVVVSTLVGAAMPTVVSMPILVVVGDGAGESVDPDHVVLTVGAN
jgi:hypothetical protein